MAIASCAGGTGFDSRPRLLGFVLRISIMQVALKGAALLEGGV